MRTNHPRGVELRGFAHNLARIAALLVVLTLVAAPLFAQTVSRIEGRVEDASGAVVPNAKITAVNVKTQSKSEATSNSQGLYVIPAVEAGTYTVTIEAAGFQKEVVKNLDVLAATTVNQGFKLKVGQATESVVVEATAVAVQTTDSQIANSVTMHDIDILPALGRTPVTLAVFQPGVQINAGDQSFSHVDGLRGGSNNSKLDGIDVNDSLVPRLGLTLTANNTDSISEFRVVTEGGKAEYGRSAGGQVEMVTRSGTNQYHGNAFDYLRNTDLNANDYFNNKTGIPTPKFIQNIYGGSFGGPILHDKTFIFGNFQGRRTRQETVRTRTVYTDAARAGLFTWTDSAGTHTFNILANDPRGKGIDPAMAAILTAVPHSNNLNVGDKLNTAGFSFNNPTPSFEDQFTIRGDHNVTNNNKAFLRWSWQRNSSIDNLNNADASFPGQAQGTQGGHRWGYSIGDDWTIGSTWANEFRFGHQSAQVVFARPERIQGPTIITNLITDPFSSTFAQGRNSPVNDITDNITKVKGNHTFKFGTNIRFTLQTGFNDQGIYPNVTLSATANGNTPNIPNRPVSCNATSSNTPCINSTQLSTLNSLYNDLLGRMDGVAVTYLSSDLTSFLPAGTTRQRDYLLNESGYYFQDDWKVRRNLTLNLGLRWEYYGLPHEKNGIQADIPNANQIDGVTTFTTSTFAQTDQWYNKDWNNFAPRVGFAWDVMGDGKTAVRGNFGVFYDRTAGSAVNQVDSNTPGFGFSGLVTPNSGAGSDVRISDGIPVPAVPAAPVTTLPVSNRATTVALINPNLRTGYVGSWNLNVQREITRNTILELGYVGNRGIKLFMYQDLNQLHVQGDFLTSFQQLQAYQAAGFAGAAPVNTITKLFPTTACTASTSALGIAANTNGATCAVASLGASNFLQGLAGSVANTIDRSTTINGRYAAAGIPQTYLRPYPQYNQVELGTNSGRSYYDALQASVRRNAGGLFLNANYTYSHSIDNITVDPNGFTSPIDNLNLASNRGNGDFDHRNSFNASFSYALPVGQGKRFGSGASRWLDELIGDWQVGSLVVAQDGTVFTVSSQRATTAVTFTSAGTATATRDNYSGDFRSGTIQYLPNGNVFFFTPQDLANFSFPAAGSIGNQGRNNFRGPYFVNVDSSLVKKFKITERQAVTFRAEAYNLFNHPNFGGIQTNVNSPLTFGQMTTTLATQSNSIGTGARTMQLTLRYDF